MKKLVFAFAAIVAVSFASCGGNTQNTEAVDSVAEEVEVVCDSVCELADSAVAVVDSIAE